MSLSSQELNKLRRIVTIAQRLIKNSPKPKRGRPALANGNRSSNGKRIRRSGKELIQFRRMLKAQRKKGVSVADLARKHNISSAYIYLLP